MVSLVRAKLFVTGVVQGVGFRPFVYNLAQRFLLHGWVLNSTDGVHIEVEGSEGNVTGFCESVRSEAPPLARIDTIQIEYLSSTDYTEFSIRHSEGDARQYVKISPDVCTCQDCLSELWNPMDKRYRYPFINCTNCGPRYTIIEDIPYDRPKTSMKAFTMCEACQMEYEDPTDRRFHAQPNACPVCGPHVWLESSNQEDQEGDAIQSAIRLLKEGKILAVKGLGGFHLACDATNEEAVLLLRNRKQRIMKPFAIMSANVDDVRSYCHVSMAEETLLLSYRRPIVLLDRSASNMIASSVAPNQRTLGVMLPYTPLHFLLLADDSLLALVMTSANMSEEPIVIDNEQARDRLAPLADAFLMHNRDIYTRCDDSVARIVPLPESPAIPSVSLLRRSRGYAPEPLDLNSRLPEMLACGGGLKNTFCLTKDNHVFFSQHIGDLENAEAYTYFEDSIEYIKRLFRISPRVIAHDLHTEYLSTKYALSVKDVQVIGVQHHQAHIASCAAEHGVRESVIGVALDGAGYGTDGAIWGGEFLHVDGPSFERCAHLRYVPLPGGDAAVKQTWRMGLSYLHDSFGKALWDLPLDFVRKLPGDDAFIVLQMIQKRVNTPWTSSMGRLFDAVSAILGICGSATYEAQAAIELEACASPVTESAYTWECKLGRRDSGQDESLPCPIDTRPLIQSIVRDCIAGVPRATIAGRFHQALANLIGDICSQMAEHMGTSYVALSGGVFQNRLLLRLVWEQLQARHLTPLVHRQVPANDGGLCLGQAWIAAQIAS